MYKCVLICPSQIFEFDKPTIFCRADDGPTEGRIVYDFDEGDDWDEEDPDDDLDI